MNRLSERTLKQNNIDLIGIDEIFTQIPDWNKYFISNHGRLVHKNDNGRYSIVNPSITEGGYLSYTLSKPARTYKGKKVRDKDGKAKGRRKCRPAQIWVAIVYLKNPYPKAEYRIEDLNVHHKDKVRTNNYFKNLMWLCKTKNGRTDHDFVDSIKKIAIYNENTGNFHTYKDIELLIKKVDVDILEFIDSVRLNEKLFTHDGKWDVYQVNGYFIGVQFMKRQSKKQ